jgi:chemotaxis signal transduction protein
LTLPATGFGTLERRQRKRSGPSLQALFFSVPGMQLCLPLEQVSRVLALPALQEVPDAPGQLVGLLNLGGEALPVVDLCRLLKRPPLAYDIDTPVLLCESGGRRCCLVAGAVSGVGAVENSQRRGAVVMRDGEAPFLAVFEGPGGPVCMLSLDLVCEGLQMDRLTGAAAE